MVTQVNKAEHCHPSVLSPEGGTLSPSKNHNEYWSQDCNTVSEDLPVRSCYENNSSGSLLLIDVCKYI